MTWHETHQRTLIMRQVEAHAAFDMTGDLPWRDTWAPYFGDRDGLLTALSSRWQRLCEAQLDPHMGDKVLHESAYRLRRTNAGILRILERHDSVPAGVVPMVRPVTRDLEIA